MVGREPLPIINSRNRPAPRPQTTLADHGQWQRLRYSGTDALVPSGEEAKSVRDITGVEAAGRHLIEQRLKRVVREPVEQRNPEPFLGQLVGCRYSPKPRRQPPHEASQSQTYLISGGTASNRPIENADPRFTYASTNRPISSSACLRTCGADKVRSCSLLGS